MDIFLNDGTLAKNVTVWEYEQLKEKGYVGNPVVTTTKTSNVTEGDIRLNETVLARNFYSTCWKCGCELNETNRASICFPTYPPKYACKSCVGEK